MNKDLFKITDQVDTSTVNLLRVLSALRRLYDRMNAEYPYAEPGRCPDAVSSEIFTSRAHAYLDQLLIFIDALDQEIETLDTAAKQVWAGQDYGSGCSGRPCPPSCTTRP